MMPHHFDDEEPNLLDWLDENQLPVCAVVGLLVVACVWWLL